MLRLFGRPKRVVSTPCFNLVMANSHSFHVEQELLLGRLKPVAAGYNLDRCCMEGTRTFILNRVMDWVTDPQERNNGSQRNTYWFYGSPGIGKTSLAHSICQRLHGKKYL